jgi:hypothetical protein
LSEDTVRFVYRGEEIASYPRSIGKVPQIDYRHISRRVGPLGKRPPRGSCDA